MTPERRVKIFKNGRNQAVRIPREFELQGDEAIMRKEGDRLVIEPARPKSLLALIKDWQPLLAPNERLPAVEDSPAEPVDL
jgi:antitoxin VapB